MTRVGRVKVWNYDQDKFPILSNTDGFFGLLLHSLWQDACFLLRKLLLRNKLFYIIHVSMFQFTEWKKAWVFPFCIWYCVSGGGAAWFGLGQLQWGITQSSDWLELVLLEYILHLSHLSDRWSESWKYTIFYTKNKPKGIKVAISTVKVSITDILPWDPKALGILIPSHRFTFMISVVFLSVVTIGLVTSVRTIKLSVTSVMGWDAVGCIELVFSTWKLPRLTVRRSWNGQFCY